MKTKRIIEFGLTVLIFQLLVMSQKAFADPKSTPSLTPVVTDDDNDGEPSPNAEQIKCRDEAIRQWIMEELTKQRDPKLMERIRDHKIQEVPEEKVETKLERVVPADLEKKGLPPEKTWIKISGGIHFSGFFKAVLGDRILLIGQKGERNSGVEDIYLQTPNGFKRLLRDKVPSDEVSLVHLGPGCPPFLKVKSVGGSGWGGIFYSLDTQGNLRTALEVGGWGAGVGYYQLEKDGNLSVINSQWANMRTDSPLFLRLDKCTPFYIAGTKISQMTVYSWKTGKFEKLGEFYFPGDEW